MKKLFNNFVVGASVLSLVGCAVTTAILPDKITWTTLEATIEQQRSVYAKTQPVWENTEQWYDVPLILLAVGSVAIAAFSHGAARGNLLIGTGLGAGIVSLYQNSINSTGKQQAYARATRQLNCLIDADQTYVTSPTNQDGSFVDVTDMKEKIQSVNDAVGHVQDDLVDVANATQAATGLTATEANAVNNANSQMSSATTALVSAQAEVDAAAHGLHIAASTFSIIDNQAYDSAKGVLVTYNQALGVLTADVAASTAPSVTGTGAAQPASAASAASGASLTYAPRVVESQKTLDQYITALATDTSTLTTNVGSLNRVLAVKSKRYTTANSLIVACASKS